MRCYLKTINFVIVFAITVSFGVALSSSADSSAHWGYQGQHGPEYWGLMKPEFVLCRTGRTQSPINVNGTNQTGLLGLRVNYVSSPVEVVNNGHTIQLNYKRHGSMKIKGKKYSLLQVHFHSPSENHIKGNGYPMEAHFVHKSNDGELAVIGVMFSLGTENRMVSEIWEYMPKKAGTKNSDPKRHINPSYLLPTNLSLYHWKGSLTTPPCSEGVQWFLLKNPVTVSKKQVREFVNLMGNNNRPIQPLLGRSVQEISE